MGDSVDFRIRTTLGDLAAQADRLEDILASMGAPAGTRYAVQLAFDEIVSNIIRHGFAGSEEHVILATLRTASDDILELVIEDDGHPFNPLSDATEADTELDLEDRVAGGLGIHLVKEKSAYLRYSREDERNILIIGFRFE